jgi:hypothetical protein
MPSRSLPIIVLLWSNVAPAGRVADATGRAAQVPEDRTRVADGSAGRDAGGGGCARTDTGSPASDHCRHGRRPLHA